MWLVGHTLPDVTPGRSHSAGLWLVGHSADVDVFFQATGDSTGDNRSTLYPSQLLRSEQARRSGALHLGFCQLAVVVDRLCKALFEICHRFITQHSSSAIDVS